MSILKDNSPKIIRMLITHIAMSVFGLAIGFSIVMAKVTPTMALIVSIFSILFYAALVYTTMWEYGSKDKPAFDGGRKDNALLTGFLCTLAAEGVFVFIALAYAISSFFGEASYFAGNVCFISNIVLWLFSGFCSGAMSFLESVDAGHIWRASVYIIASLFISGVGAFGYALGTKDLTIIPKKANVKK